MNIDTIPFVAAPPAPRAGLPNARDMSHHLNSITKRRQANKLKELYKYAALPGMVPMAGGVPSPTIFPFETLSADILPYNHLPLDPPRVPKKQGLLEWLFSSSAPTTEKISIPKYAADPKDPMAIQLSTSLQYAAATGPPAFPIWLRKYVETVFKPAFADWDVLLDVGATDAMTKVCNMLLVEGDSVMVEEWTYPGAMNAYLPYDVNVVGLPMDNEGIIPADMDKVLSSWNEEKQGPRPRLLYTVPTGQNPTGATMLAERRKAVYDICSKYDVVIVEDEPYYCLFMDAYVPRDAKLSPMDKAQRDAEKLEGKKGNEAFLKSLPPSFLHFDTDGRVIRFDTFSKTSCPGSRLGWITSSPIFIERLTRIAECGTQAPSGFATALTLTMLNHWGWDGYVRWLRGIKANYRMKRDWMLDALADSFHLESDGSSINPLVLSTPLGRGYTAYARPDPASPERRWDEKRGVQSAHGAPLISFIPPSAGMFIFLGVHLNTHPEYRGPDDTRTLMDKLWRTLAKHHVLFAPGWAFDANGPHNIGGDGVGYFRLSFSIVTYEQTRESMEVFAKVLKQFLRA
ncbi:PLP-dependent transferase [Cutaneotrichosporon oleaginosum]|uniref:PLP-dependent transferase n=1 Tax=Cutaneotrichosporon oleaginosum TaxID=879819 RepID=A0A0J0XXA6_9TREE|nr:PLP-dependent transferase [Cutaneotrichosporon oleaginosum]KLT45680.1 PLP-dependent transferase [Cutaneotrichosporon oleaginosum]TXT04530.1 hypothetical protein COLE_07349 [Cutaneotrichosporon oleaginosum]